MKTIARLALTPGMVLWEDVNNYKGQLVLPADTVLTEDDIQKLERHQVIAVTIKEAYDFATTAFERTIYSEEYIKFNEVYKNNLNAYRYMIDDFINNRTPINTKYLLNLHDTVMETIPSDYMALRYLYFSTPTEEEITYTHCFNSALIASVFGNWLFMPKEDIRTLVLCGFLYDIGKISIPAKVLWKPGKLNAFEFNWVKTHTTNGYNLVKEQPLDPHIINCVVQHHEKPDGSGYPNHLTWDEIDVYAKYISIIDTYEAMTSVRSYRAPLTPFQVISNFEKMMNESIEGKFIIKPILEKLASYQLGTTIKLSNEMTGEVVYINPEALSKPLLKVNDSVYDLREHPELEVVAIL